MNKDEDAGKFGKQFMELLRTYPKNIDFLGFPI
jgi:hypothetical protein